MEKTFKELQEIDSVVAQLYRETPTLERTKFGYAYKRFYEKNLEPLITKLNDELADLRLENALTDAKTNEVLYANPNQYKYDKEGLKVVMKEGRDIKRRNEEVKVEVKPFISSYIPETLTDDEKELLNGCLINV